MKDLKLLQLLLAVVLQELLRVDLLTVISVAVQLVALTGSLQKELLELLLQTSVVGQVLMIDLTTIHTTT